MQDLFSILNVPTSDRPIAHTTAGPNYLCAGARVWVHCGGIAQWLRKHPDTTRDDALTALGDELAACATGGWVECNVRVVNAHGVLLSGTSADTVTIPLDACAPDEAHCADANNWFVYPAAAAVPGECCSDLVTLPYLHEAALMQSILQRYKSTDSAVFVPYTFLSNVLVALNPYRDLPNAYTRRVRSLYRKQPLGANAPHVYAIAEDAYQHMLVEQRSQCVLISGESGTGKTFTTHQVLEYIAEASETRHKTLAHAVVASIDLLEAFGNARTAANDNSSRFGRFIKMFFTPAGELLNARVQTYLLERGRVANFDERGRNFHVFYQLCTGLQPAERKALQVRDDCYGHAYLRCCDSTASGTSVRRSAEAMSGAPVDCAAEAANFKHTRDALRLCGFSEAEQNRIWMVLAAILQLGDVEFVDEDASTADNGSDDRLAANINKVGRSDSSLAQKKVVVVAPNAAPTKSSTAPLRRPAQVTLVAATLGVEEEHLRTALTSQCRVVNGERFVTQLSAAEAEKRRDSLATTLYQQLFAWLVRRVNDKLGELASPTARSGSHVDGSGGGGEPLFIGVLDIYGFEVMQHNSLEQLMINYANEKLQHHFDTQLIQREQREYVEEGVVESPNTNGAPTQPRRSELVVNAFESSPGILSLLDEQCRLKKHDAKEYVGKLCALRDLEVKAVKMQPTEFAVRHYASSVNYNAAQLVEKNEGYVTDEHRVVLDAVIQACDRISATTASGNTANALAWLGTVQQQQQAPSQSPVLGRQRMSTASDANNPRMQRAVSAANAAAATGSVESLRIESQKSVSDQLSPLAPSPRSPRPTRAGTPGAGSRSGTPVAGAQSAFRSTCSEFRASLAELMEVLATSHCHYIRCIKPNDSKRANQIDGQRVIEQLRASGITQAALILSAGYPCRLTFDEFLRRYDVLQSRGTSDTLRVMPPAQRAQYILRILPHWVLNSEHYFIGRTRVLLRIGRIALLEKYRNRLERAVTLASARWRAVRARREYLRARLSRRIAAWLSGAPARRSFVSDLLIRKDVKLLQAEAAAAATHAVPPPPAAVTPSPSHSPRSTSSGSDLFIGRARHSAAMASNERAAKQAQAEQLYIEEQARLSAEADLLRAQLQEATATIEQQKRLISTQQETIRAAAQSKRASALDAAPVARNTEIVKELRARCAKLEADLAAALRRASEVEREKARIDGALRALTNEMASNDAAAREASALVAKAESRALEAERSVLEMQKQFAESGQCSQSEVDALEEQLSSVRSELSEAYETAEHHREDAEAYQRAADEARAQIAILEEKLTSAEETIGEQGARVVELELQVRELQTRIDSPSSSLHRSASDSVSQSTVDSSRESLDDDLRHSNALLLQQLQQSNDALKAVVKENEDLQIAYDRLQKSLQRSTSSSVLSLREYAPGCDDDGGGGADSEMSRVQFTSSEHWVLRFIYSPSLFAAKCTLYLSHTDNARYIEFDKNFHIPLESHVLARYAWCSANPLPLLKCIADTALRVCAQYRAELAHTSATAVRAQQYLSTNGARMRALFRFYSMLLALSRSMAGWNPTAYVPFTGGLEPRATLDNAFDEITQQRDGADIQAPADFDVIMQLCAELLVYDLLTCVDAAVTPLAASLRMTDGAESKVSVNASVAPICDQLRTVQAAMRAVYLPAHTVERLVGEMLSVIDRRVAYRMRWTHPLPVADPGTEQLCMKALLVAASLFSTVIRPLHEFVSGDRDTPAMPHSYSCGEVLGSLNILADSLSAAQTSTVARMCKYVDKTVVLATHSRWYSGVAVRMEPLDSAVPEALAQIQCEEYAPLVQLWSHATPPLHRSMLSFSNTLAPRMARYAEPFA